MKIKIINDTFTDNTKELEQNDYFLLTKTNERFLSHSSKQIPPACVITPTQFIKKFNLLEGIKIIAISGTNGKTSTACMIYSFLLDLGFKAALCGTRGFFVNDKRLREKGLTTPMNLEILANIYEAKSQGCEYFVMEVSSHAIVQNRFEGLKFCAKVFTNLSQDHLDYHKSMAEYRRVKESFFADEGLKIMNADEDFSYNYKGSITYGLENPAFYQVKAYSLRDEIHAVVAFHKKTYLIESKLLGKFNLYNLLAASATINELLRPDLSALEEAILSFGGVKGRLEEILPRVFVDFAHTPDGVLNVLEALKYRPLVVVLGAGGNRDKSKRSLMGQIASKFARKLILTSDNPRFEDPKSIINELAKLTNPSKTIIEVCRQKALEIAYELKRDEDILIVLGKGDETYQEIRGQKLAFSDEEVLKNLASIKNN